MKKNIRQMDKIQNKKNEIKKNLIKSDVNSLSNIKNHGRCCP